MAEYHNSALRDVLEQLETGADGLSSQDARARLDRYGRNELKVSRDTPEIVKFLLQFKNFFAILLIMGGALALTAERLDPGQGNLYIAIALIAVVFLNAAFTYFQEHQSERIMDSFRKMLPSMITALRDGRPQEIAAAELVPGDVIVLNEGDRVPADGRLIEAKELKVDNASLTGESEPQLLDAGKSANAVLESPNMVFSGSLVQNGEGKVVLVETGMNTQIGSIVALTKATDAHETPIHKELKYFIKVISFIAIFLGVSFFAVSVAIGNGVIGSLIFAIGIIVANVPEGLLPTVTLSLTMASRRMAQKNALIKNLESVETLGSTTVICTDKTGTLTQNRLGVNTVVVGGKEHAASDKLAAGAPAFGQLLRVMCVCNNAYLTEDGFAGDATEGALLIYAQDHVDLAALRKVEEIAEQPFNSITKRMITVTDAGDGPEAMLKGAPEVVLAMCDRIALNGGEYDLTEERRAEVIQTYRTLAGRGERGLAFAARPCRRDEMPETGYVFLGLTGMIDPPRPEVPDALARCHSAGIRVIMLTGDFGLTAKTIAQQIGMVGEHGRVIQGDELSAMSETELQKVLRDEPEIIFARIAPAQKMQVVQALQANGETVTVTGDGVNDAPALKNADMGVAMGVMGTDVAKEASNMVLMDDNFATIVTAVEEGRTIFDNIKKFIAYILTSNIPEILPFIAFVLLDIPLPLTVILILSIDLGTDILPALGLGAEKPETDVMKRRPRPRGERLLSRKLLLMSYGIVGMLQAAAGFFTYFTILYSGGWEWGQDLASSDPLYRTAITGFFASIIICQVADVIICRTRRQSLLTVGFWSNKLVLVGIAFELLLLASISYIPAFNTFFGTAPLELWHLMLSVPFALTILIGDEIRRVFVRRGNPFVLRWLTW
ncbi:HAD-IC family P-type ATPase [Primorskyibacter aestuariivivens]|uniref:cation-translocating P-type ATPase n=1 Tax=Primorskyibacter aestuariivivens TaxID=1888912 RepID=UPI0023001C86|nr:HAD-IC family P-type ATPase [Primorskyibacter aestuariivivens]MDA7427143.1 HAD-IC family P-type ATPase [Primorskyibacter aestuariivivens]